jgi:hypothetical protein
MSTSPPPSASEPSQRGSLLGRVWPLVLALVLVGWMLSRVDTSRVLEAMASVPKLPLVGMALGFVGALLLADTWATQQIYARTVCPVTWRELIVLRGASYLPSVLNYHLGQGWLTYFLSRVYGARLLHVAGATLIVYITTFACLVGIGLLALFFNGARLPWLVPTLAVCVSAGLGYLAVLAIKPRWLLRWPVLEPLFELGIVGHLRFALARVPHMIVLFLGTWLPFLLFGIDVPLRDALALVPPLLFVTGLPLTPQGIGTRDVLAASLFAAYAPESAGTERILAATLSWTTALSLGLLLVSPLFMRRAYRLLGR